jgi:hypothetical protein
MWRLAHRSAHNWTTWIDKVQLVHHAMPVRWSTVEPTQNTGGSMTETREAAAVISEALSVIDKALSEMLNRDLVSTGEVADLLLDVRSWVPTKPDKDRTRSADVRLGSRP